MNGHGRLHVNAWDLKLLLHCPSESKKCMIIFILLAHQTMASLLETVPAMEHTWIECLGGLKRNHMAIEEDDSRS